MTYEQKIRMALALDLAPPLLAVAEFEFRRGRLPSTKEDRRVLGEFLGRHLPLTAEEVVSFANRIPPEALKTIPTEWLAKAEQWVAAFDKAASHPA